MIIKNSSNSHTIKKKGDELDILLISDVHFDSLKCDRELLKKHFNQIKEKKGKVLIIGDWFDVMGTFQDPRSKPDQVRREYYQKGRSYLDLIVEDSYEFLKPYRENLAIIGYGNHECYREDTEVLTMRGWVKIPQVTTDDVVACFDGVNILYAKPLDTVRKKADTIYKIEGQVSNQYVSAKHNVVLNDMSRIHAEDLPEIKDTDLPHNRVINEMLAIDADPNIVELITATVMDATVVSRKDCNAKRIQFKLSKPEKIEYIKDVLHRNNIEYTFRLCKKTGLNKLQPYYITIYGEAAKKIYAIVGPEKKLPKHFTWMTGKSFDAFIKALEHTDASRQSNVTLAWNTTDKDNVNMVQAMCVHNGWHLSYYENETGSGFENGKLQYRCSITKEISKPRKVKVTKEAHNGYVYCLTMPTGNFVTRINGKVAYSGNTNISRRHDTDIIDRLVFLLNMEGRCVEKGGYQGAVKFQLEAGTRVTFKLAYHHGHGGAKRSKGVLNSQLDTMKYRFADCIVSGHDHNKIHDPSNVVFDINTKGEMIQKAVHWLKLGSYKKSSTDHGFEVERGFFPSKLGGWFLNLKHNRTQFTEDGKVRERHTIIPTFTEAT